MPYWIFDTQDAANTAQQAVADTLPDDTLADGVAAPVQVTKCWDVVQQTTHRKWAFTAKPGMDAPAGATEVDASPFLAPAQSP